MILPRIVPLPRRTTLRWTKRENKPYGTNLTFPVEEYSCFHQTSGTMGEPMAWLDTAEDWNWMLGNWDRVLEGAGVQSRRVVFCLFVWPVSWFLDGLRCRSETGLPLHSRRRAGERTAPAFDPRARGRIFVLYTDLCLAVAGSGQASRYRLERPPCGRSSWPEKPEAAIRPSEEGFPKPGGRSQACMIITG